ncbi:ketosynthase chain-length factor [Lentzea sp. NPDC054927]
MRTVVTGLGVVAPNGVGVEEYWQATLAGQSAIAPVTRFDASGYPARLAGEITGFAVEEHLADALLPQTDRVTRLSLVTADWAIADSGIVPGQLRDYDIGVVTASSSGGFEFGQRELQALWSKGGRYVSAYQSFAWFYAVNSGQISIRNGTRGPSSVVVTDEAGGLDAVAHARRQVRKGTPVVVTGAVDAAICPWGWVAQLASERLSTSDDPRRAYLPFDDRANGHVCGEGGAILLLEEGKHACERGARSYGEIAGWASTMDGQGESGLRRAIELALSDAHSAPEEIDVVFADAAGTSELDLIEAEAITKVFGPRGVPVTAPKTMVGRLCAGAGPLDLATACLAMRDGVIPPTVHTEQSERHDLELVTAPRDARVRAALVLARGNGGFNSAMVVHANS